MRVAVRRSRALLRAGRTLVATDTQDLLAELKWLGEVLGAVRDLDVLLERLRAEAAALGGDGREGCGAPPAQLTRERKRARAALLRALDGERYLALLDRFEATLNELEPTGADVSLDALARRELKQLRKAVEALPEPSRVTKSCTICASSASAPATRRSSPENVTSPSRRSSFQDVLGEHQDATVAEARLRALGAAAPPPAEALAAGRLIERERARQAAARAAWPDAWRKLDRASR